MPRGLENEAIEAILDHEPHIVLMTGIGRIHALRKSHDSLFHARKLSPKPPFVAPPAHPPSIDNARSKSHPIHHASRPLNFQLTILSNPSKPLQPPLPPILARRIHSSPRLQAGPAQTLFGLSLVCIATFMIATFWSNVRSWYVEAKQFAIEQKRLNATDKRLEEGSGLYN